MKHMLGNTMSYGWKKKASIIGAITTVHQQAIMIRNTESGLFQKSIIINAWIAERTRIILISDFSERMMNPFLCGQVSLTLHPDYLVPEPWDTDVQPG